MVDDDDDDEEEEGGEQAGGMGLLEGDMEMGDADGEDTRVVLHEDKKYYPTAMEVYGEQVSAAPRRHDGVDRAAAHHQPPGLAPQPRRSPAPHPPWLSPRGRRRQVETTVQEEDTQPITQPIVAPIKPKDFDLVEKKLPTTRYSTEFLTSLMAHPALVRNIAVIGHLHHGKTSLIDNLVQATHVFETPASREGLGATLMKETRYTDSRVDEQKRGLSIKAMPMTLTGSCRCGAVRFTVDSHTPVPYQLCYCSICRKTAGGGGYAINLGGVADSLGWVES